MREGDGQPLRLLADLTGPALRLPALVASVDDEDRPLSVRTSRPLIDVIGVVA